MSLSASAIMDVIASQFTTDPNKPAYIALARDQVSQCVYGRNYEKAVALRASHEMTVDTNPAYAGGSGGAIQSKREGDLSVSFAVNKSAKGSAYLSLTSYGQRLEELRKGHAFLMGVTGAGPTFFCSS